MKNLLLIAVLLMASRTKAQSIDTIISFKFVNGSGWNSHLQYKDTSDAYIGSYVIGNHKLNKCHCDTEVVINHIEYVIHVQIQDSINKYDKMERKYMNKNDLIKGLKARYESYYFMGLRDGYERMHFNKLGAENDMSQYYFR